MDNMLANQIGANVPRMYRVAYRLLADADLAQDVVQEACVKALTRMDGFQGRSTLFTWLHSITLNCVKDALRSKVCREQVRDSLQSSYTTAVTSCPSKVAEEQELLNLARTMLDKLPNDCRTAFALTQLDGYSYDEAAELENEPRGTIASRVHRAKKILLAQLTELVDEKAGA